MVRVPLSSETGLQSPVLRLVDIQQYHFTSLQALDHYETRLLQLHTGNAAMIRKKPGSGHSLCTNNVVYEEGQSFGR